MKKNNLALFICVVLISFPGVISTSSDASGDMNSSSDKIVMNVKSKMLSNENIPVIIILKEKPGFQSVLKEDMVSSLKNRAYYSQNDLETFLNEEQSKGKANNMKKFWIVNAISINASPQLIETLSAREDVASIELDSQVHTLEDYSAQVSQEQIDTATNAIKRINATTVWESGIDGSGINVSVIDSGMNASHPDIYGRVIKWNDFIGSSTSPYDDNGHGTHVAGTVGGNGKQGTTTGVAPNVSLFGAKVLDATGSGDASDVTSGIEWSVENKADIICLSLGGDNRNTAMTTAINNAISAGVIVVAAAGNNGPNSGTIKFPGGEKNVIAVGAVYSSDIIYYYSSRGPITVDGEILTKPDIVAPGVTITSLSNLSDSYNVKSGTSMATPHVSGAAALLLQASKKDGIILTPAQVKSILENTSIDLGDSGKDNVYGAGRINVSAAVFSIDNDGPSVIAHPATYPDGFTAARNGTAITLNASISDAITGVKNVTINASAINASLDTVFLSNISGFWINDTIGVNARDGIYYLNITAYDNAGNINNSEKFTVIVDNTPPGVNINPVSYQRGNAANNMSVITFNISATDPLINDISSGLNNASINATLINKTGLIKLTNQSDLWTGNVTCDKFVADGNYSLNAAFIDGAGNSNDSGQINVSIDNTPPSVSDILLNSKVEVGGFNNITANITDNFGLNISDINLSVKYPDGSSKVYAMSPGGEIGNIFYHNISDTAQYGRYNVTIIANDTTGNSNSSKKTWFVTTMPPYVNNSINTTANNVTEIDAREKANTTLELFTSNDTSGGAINITLSSIIPPEINQTFSLTPLGKYIEIYASQDLNNSITSGWMIIKLYYTSAELNTLDENTLKISWYNESSTSWEILGAGSQTWVHAAGVAPADINGFAGYVWANISHLSTFGIVGSHSVSSIVPLSSGGGGGSSGGGGGGASGEEYSNIQVTEKYDLSIYKDKVTSYRFTNNNNPVMYVNITGNISFGEITTSIEVLKANSSMVKIQPPGIVYKNVNIWAGSSSFNRPANIKEGIIRFRVLNSWLESNSITNVNMVMWAGSDWKQLETNRISKDMTYTYYETSTRSFAHFAITGTKGQTNVQIIAQAEKTHINSTQSPVPVADQTKKAPGFEIMTLLLLCFMFYLFRDL